MKNPAVENERDERDWALVQRARAGDSGAFGDLVRAHADAAFGLALSFLKNRPDAEDASQEGFLKAFRNLDSFEGPGGFRPWLLTIVANTCRNRLRWQKLRNFWHVDGDETLIENQPEPPGPAQDSAETARALESLTEQQRLAVQLKFVEGHKIREVAQIMGLSEGTVKTHLYRGVAQLRKILKEEPNGM